MIKNSKTEKPQRCISEIKFAFLGHAAIFVNMKIITKVNLPYPCALNWEDLSEGDNEKLCNSCGKIVPDFSRLSDRELLNFFYSVNGSDQLYCCRLKSSQLNRNLNSGNAMLRFGKYAALLFTSFLGIKTAESQTTVAPVQTHTNNTPFHFKGTVVDEITKMPVANAIVKLFSGSRELTTFTCDAYGRFDILLNENQSATGKIKVQITTADNRVNVEEEVEWNQLKYYFRRAIPVYTQYITKVSSENPLVTTKSKVTEVKTNQKQKNKYKRRWWKKRKKHHPMGCISF